MGKPTSYFVFFATTSANLLTMSAGWAYGWSSIAIPKLNGLIDPDLNPIRKPTTLLQDSWVTSLLHLGSSFSPIFAGKMADQLGRKATLLIFGVVMLIANVITIFADCVEHFYVARFLLGLGCGAVWAVIPMYTAEISEVDNRGFLNCILGILVTFSTLVCFCVGPYVSISTMGYISASPVAIFLVVFGLIVPESPYYYVLKSNEEAARSSFMRLRRVSTNTAEKEVLDIKRSFKLTSGNEASFLDLFRSQNARKALLITAGLMFFQQATGICGILSYLQSFFDDTGSKIPSDISAMAVGLVQFISVSVLSGIVDRFGRRVFLIISASGLIVALSGLGVFFTLKNLQYNLDSLFWVPVFCVMLFITCFAGGIGPLPWTILSEIFPLDVKFYGSSVVTWFCLFFSFVITVCFPIFTAWMGITVCMWFFAGCTTLMLVFVVFYVPETKGKTFEEIQMILSKQ
ncbi:unnamed protein product [Brassicogethes aeneus]|uniref:Major facilitator superfamily (MFS) profile domain-containing protein n=1 Tax=Brassicogethes aeneus TaxID=1431903 RepID=A0A9P0BMA6_BRAAE|nr:unnamed protein product [Brassicogethes aeneus]